MCRHTTRLMYRLNRHICTSVHLHILSFVLFLLFLFSLQSCKDDELVTPSSPTMNYVSNDAGKWIVYDCDSIIHLDNDNNTDNNVEISQFQIKEVIDSIGIDGENQPIQHLSRFKRANDTLQWTFLSRWTAKITSGGYQKVEDNTRYLKLGFPISNAQKWNGNSYNTLGEEDYIYNGINEPAGLASFSFDSTLTVVQGDSTIGYHTYPSGIEKYATGIGMYYRYYAAVDFYPGTVLIISGVEYSERISSYGHY